MRRVYALVVAVVVATVLAMTAYTGTAAAPAASFAVKIVLPNGHGSGVHIGHGYVLTAQHVTAHGEPKVLTNTGTMKGTEVLWANDAYDVALLRIADYDDVASVPLSCAELTIGTRYTAYGNPSFVDFISADGDVVGPAVQRGHWASVVTVNGSIVDGMSGGGVVSRGRLVGITVGTMLHPAHGDSVSFTGFGFVVPGSAICGLLAR